MISASRSYQNNIEVMNTAKSLLLKTLHLLPLQRAQRMTRVSVVAVVSLAWTHQR